MRHLLPLLLLLTCTAVAATGEEWKTTFELGNGNQTATYQETIAFYKKLAEAYDEVQLLEYGTTDAGYPLHLCVISRIKVFDPATIQHSDHVIFLINNAIHPGEPEGVDATMMLARDLLQNPAKKELLNHCTLLIIPMYNIGGALNRNSHSRANQNGPDEYGFRGNAQNLDLNRDFIKCDSRNAHTFTQIFQTWKPHIFLDNHTSNGADYQHVMTLIPTQKDKLAPILSAYMVTGMVQSLYEGMVTSGYPMAPYVDPIKMVPDSGIVGFLETPRYSSGYTTLFNTIGFISETHMLKPFDQRVKATYALMENMLTVIERDHAAIKEARVKADNGVKNQPSFPLRWSLDENRHNEFLFKGYEAKYKPSAVSGQDRLYYDRARPYEKNIPLYNHYKTDLEVKKPYAYIIPQGWGKVIERLEWNGVAMQSLHEAVTVEVEVYQITDYDTYKRPYEGHYVHHSVKVEPHIMKKTFLPGDKVVVVNQTCNRYIVETLEPQAHDAFFAWNFFDAILQQKEWYSPYVFEDVAAKMLEDDAALKKEFEAKKRTDEKFAQDAQAQLYFLYTRSPNYEASTYNYYPVVRLLEPVALPVK